MLTKFCVYIHVVAIAKTVIYSESCSASPCPFMKSWDTKLNEERLGPFISVTILDWLRFI